jgi:sucrose-6-phosphate hydrolase SacC (GH32 family)
VALAMLFTRSAAAAQDEIVFADFEGETHGAWKAEGTAFGTAPAPGTLANQMPVTGYQGQGLANSFHGGDASAGRLISPDFVISRKFIAFRIGGGGFAGRTCVNLIVDQKVVRTATGPNIAPGGSERLRLSGWDVRNLAGRTARLEIVDAATGGWGHITLDQITFTDTRPPIAAPPRRDVSRTLTIEKRRLNFPVKNDGPKRTVTLRVGDTAVRRFDIPLADDDKEDWWAPVDVLAWTGKPLTITVDELPADSRALERVTNTEQIAGHESLYREALRPQFHFSAQRGWLNDPNGLVCYGGEYHLFFQHSPFTWPGDQKYWGQAVSKDLVHWTEIGEALYPDELGEMYSGSAVVDWKNTSGFGKDGKPPLVLIYTAAGSPFVQCIAYSTDGRQFTKYAGNPVIGNLTGGNRDPKVLWHEPTRRWVQVLYVEKDKTHTVTFFTSPNLRDWTQTSVASGTAGTNFLYECPDFFELPVDGDTKTSKWVLMGADSQYSIGTFDGTRFVPETPPLPGHRGRGYYAPQTFSDAPKGRRIQIGWWQTETRGMPFNQSMSLPLELHLVSTADGPRLTWTPVKELESLRAATHHLGPVTVGGTGAANPLAALRGELFEIRAEFLPGDAADVAFTVRGVSVVYDVKAQEIVVNGHRAPAPLRDGKQRLTIYADRTGLEVFAGDGLTFVPMPVNLNPEDTSLSAAVTGGDVRFTRLDVYELRGAWK